MTSAQTPTATNRLLSFLPDEDRKNLLGACDQVELALGQMLNETDTHVQHVYFPTDSFISLLMAIDSRLKLEVRLVGNEGMYGAHIMLGVDIAPFDALVQGAGSALRIPAVSFLEHLDRSPALQRILKRYLYVSMKQLARSAACNRFHLVEERLARWLLMTMDRAHSNSFRITHEFLAQMLGVRRVGITKSMGLLQKRNLISYSRGNVRIHNVAGLENISCHCYRDDKQTYENILHV